MLSCNDGLILKYTYKARRKAFKAMLKFASISFTTRIVETKKTKTIGRFAIEPTLAPDMK